MNRDNIGIVDLGTIRQYHAEQLTSLTAQRDVVLAGGIDVAESARQQFETSFDAHEELYEHVDAVIITTPNRYHEEYAVDAIESGLTCSSRSRSLTPSRAHAGTGVELEAKPLLTVD